MGDYDRADGVGHGFVWRRGRFTTIDGPRGTGATLTDLDDRGRVIGVSSGDPASNGAGGAFTRIDVPGAFGSGATGINDHGTIVGLYGNPDAAPVESPPSASRGR